MAAWSVPGFELERRLGGDGDAEAWLARDRSTLETVVVRCTPSDPGVDEERLRRLEAMLTGVRHPHLVAVRAMVRADAGLALVSDFVPGGRLAELLLARGALTAAEVLTLGVPLAAALAVLHSRSLVHGAVSTENVVLTRDGRPMLASLGVRALDEADDDPATPADDVKALAEVLRAALGGWVPAELSCIDRALAPSPTDRPSAAELARELGRAGAPAPLRLAGSADERSGAPVAEAPADRASPAGELPDADHPDGLPGRRRKTAEPPVRPARRPSLAMLAGVPLALVAAVLAGRAWAAADRPAAPPPLSSAHSAPATPAATDWSAIVRELDSRRDAAMANLDAEALREVYAEGSAPLAVDLAAIRAMTAARARPDGLRLEIESVRVLRRTTERATLQVVDRLPPYDVVGAGGGVLERREGRGAASWSVDLVRAGDGWRIQAVTRG